ncbi:MAG: transketolase C-terminal domain-containing protein [Syntrophotaleaceae bacterium]
MGRDPEQSFVIPEAVRCHMGKTVERGAALVRDWQQLLETRCDLPRVSAWQQLVERGLPEGWQELLPSFGSEAEAMATRKASGLALNALAAQLPLLLGGSADLAPSNNTALKNQAAFGPGVSGRNIHFGVREHAMGAILNGLAHTPGLIPYGGTFLIFSDYMRPPMRLAAMMGLAPVYVFTHDSIGLGEDGPTHQPIEQLASLRAIPNLVVIRPADANEAVVAWRVAIAERCRPTALVLSRQNLPIIDRNQHGAVEGVARGGYVLATEQGPLQALLIASGSEVPLALEAWEILQQQGIATRLVSLPSWELFDEQPQAYRHEVLPPACTVRLAVEAASPFGWERYVGDSGAVLGMTGFGASAPATQLQKHFGFTAEAVVARVEQLLQQT